MLYNAKELLRSNQISLGKDQCVFQIVKQNGNETGTNLGQNRLCLQCIEFQLFVMYGAIYSTHVIQDLVKEIYL